MSEHNTAIYTNMQRFIKKNKNLLHLDLSQTNLTEYMLWKIGSSLSRGRTIVAVHFSGNPGVTPSVKAQLFNRIRCKNMKLERNFRLEAGIDMYDLGERKSEGERKPVPEHLFQDDKQARMIKKQSVLNVMTSEQVEFKSNQILTFERQLGFKEIMPGSGQWRQLMEPRREKCWMCNQSSFVLVLWTKARGMEEEYKIDPLL